MASPVPKVSLAPISPRQFGFSQAHRLLWRAGFGGTAAQVGLLAEWGPEQAVDSLLSVEALIYPGPSADDFDGSIMTDSPQMRQALAQARRSQDENALAELREARQSRQRRDRAQIAEMQKWWLTRMIETTRPLEEKMTLFWHGHFATSYRTIENSYHMFLQNALFRRHALGAFGGLLSAIIRDPAMLAYLDNNDSRKGRPNENLARELMELFSLGEGAYSERDIKEGARALTGYTFEGNAFVFREAAHDDGVKHILGRSGRFNGDDFVSAILRQPACADFIMWKLYRFFIGPLPPQGAPARARVVTYIKSLAHTLRSGDYALKPVLRKLLLSQHFYDEHGAPPRIKSPAELVVGAMRSLRPTARDLGSLCEALDLMGQNLFYPPSVKGWDGGRAWINTSTLFVRSNILHFLMTGRAHGRGGRVDDAHYDGARILEGVSRRARRDPQVMAEHVLRCALCVQAPPEKVAALTAFFASRGENNLEQTVGEALTIIATMPEYQLC